MHVHSIQFMMKITWMKWRCSALAPLFHPRPLLAEISMISMWHFPLMWKTIFSYVLYFTFIVNNDTHWTTGTPECYPSCSWWVDISNRLILSWASCDLVWPGHYAPGNSWVYPVCWLMLQSHNFTYHASRLTNQHTGEYLAKVVADCLRRYGLQDRVCDQFFIVDGK